MGCMGREGMEVPSSDLDLPTPLVCVLTGIPERIAREVVEVVVDVKGPASARGSGILS